MLHARVLTSPVARAGTAPFQVRLGATTVRGRIGVTHPPGRGVEAVSSAPLLLAPVDAPEDWASPAQAAAANVEAEAGHDHPRVRGCVGNRGRS
jgi:hypothetical protein